MISLRLRKIKAIYFLILLNGINIVVPAILGNSENSKVKELCKISVKKKTADCSGHGKNVSTIPNVPKFVEKLYLDSDYFISIDKNTFDSIHQRNITLVALSVKSSRVHYVGPKAFTYLASLKSLDLNSNPKLNISSLKNSFTSLKSKNIGAIRLCQMRLMSKTFPEKFFSSFSSKTIDFISLAHNTFSNIPDSFMEGLEHLKQIDLSYNNLQKCDSDLSRLKSTEEMNLEHNEISFCNVTMLPRSLKVLRMTTNELKNVPSFCSSPRTQVTLLPALHTLFLDKNSIRNLTESSFDCLPNLKKLYLKFNRIRTFESKVFLNLPNLELLNLSHMKRKVIRIKEGAFSISSLKKFYFGGNNFNFDTKRNAKHASLSNCSKMELLDLSMNYLPKWSLETRFLLHGLNNLRKINLKQVRWNTLPNDLFKMIPNVQIVDLAQNGITQLNRSLFSNESKIVEMNLGKNRITHIGRNTFANVFWESIRFIDLSGNPFACDCQLRWFRDILRDPKQLNVTFREYPREYFCLSPPKRKGLKLAYFNISAEECEEKSELIIILASSGSFVIVGLLLTLVVYKGRWHIRYWIYLLRYKKNGYRRIHDGSFIFDGFIIYSDADSEFVHNTLLNKLEQENGYKMCVHFRDFEVGKIIVDNIVECMSQSRQALIVVSKQFA